MMNIRLKAYELFKAVVRDGGYSNLVISNGLSDDIYLTDRAFITALVYGTIDKLYNIDYVISLFAKGRLQPRVQDVLRLSVYQLLYMDVAEYTVCNEAVNLISAVGKSALKGYVNGILRNILRNKSNIGYPDKNTDTVRYLSVKYSWPEFFAKEMLEQYGIDEAEQILGGLLHSGVSVSANNGKMSDEELYEALTKKKYQPKRGSLYENVYYIKGNRIFNDELYRNGMCTAQSETSVMICKAVDPQAEDRILDCCAAPGGKTVYMAQLMKTGEIIACDLHKHRCELIDANAERCVFSDVISTKCADATKFDPTLGEFDRVLVDAPCSGIGVAGTKPDIKLNMSSEGMLKIQKMQKSILNNACKYVKSGGILVYSTCTIRREENAVQVRDFLDEHPEFRPDPFCLPNDISHDADQNGFIQLLPNKHGVYGFFIARLKRL